MDNATAPVISKSQYAVLKNVTPGRVTQWIAEGKILSDALVGTGRAAKINVALADAHLRRQLDISQRLGNGLSTRLGTEVAKPSDDPPPRVAELNLMLPEDPVEEQIKREKLESARFDNRRKAEEEAARAGRYVDAQGCSAEMAKLAAKTITIYDGALPEIAGLMSANFNLSQRDVLHFLRAEFRTVRARAAGALREAASQVEPLTDVEPLDEQEPV